MVNYKDKHSVCAVIISYNGIDMLFKTIELVIDLVDKLIVVDNNSSDTTKDYLIKIDNVKVDVIFNTMNMGIASALNQGVKKAASLGYKWILTLDQDSKVHQDMLSEMFNVYDSLNPSLQDKLALIAPHIVYQGYGDIDTNRFQKPYIEKDVVITSGNLIKSTVLEDINGYNDDLFIDAVDFDLCLRLRNKGYKILMCNNAYLFHSLGEKKQIDLCFMKFTIHTHNCVRKYYMARNHIYIIKNYLFSNSLFCIKKSIFFIILILQSMLFESDRLKSLRCFSLGIKDGISNKLGENQHAI